MSFPQSNFSQPQDWMIYVNSVTNGYFGYFFLVIVFIASISGLGYLPIHKAFAGAMWITTFMAILLYFSGVIPWIPLFVCVILTVCAALMLKFSEN